MLKSLIKSFSDELLFRLFKSHILIVLSELPLAKTNFSKLLATVETAGGSFVICRDGEPVAGLVAHKSASRSQPPPGLSKIKIKYDPVETAAEGEWPGRFR